MPRPTVVDVARHAGVSPKTVSNVVNRTARVAPQTRLRVERAMADLDYVPNLSARGLRNGRTGIIALALPDLATPYSAAVAHHVVAAAAERHWSVQIQETGMDLLREQDLLSRARRNLVDGLILNPVRLETSAVQQGVTLPPVVLIGEVDQPIADHVWIDNVAAAREMTEWLISEGHRRIAVLGAMRSETSRLRLRGYRQAMRTAGLPITAELEIPCDEWTAHGGAQAMAHFLERAAPPDALFCFTDSMAVGALHALSAVGCRVPHDVSLAGYDDVPESRFVVPSLSTIAFDKQQFAEAALILLARRIAEPARPVERRTVPYRIVRRASVLPR